MNDPEIGNANELSNAATNPKLDWRDSLARNAFEEALGRQRALGLINQSDPDVIFSLEQILACQTAIRSGNYPEARAAVRDGWDTLSPTFKDTAAAINLISSTKVADLERAVELAHPLGLADAHNSLGKLTVGSDLVASEAHFKLALLADPKHYRALTNLGNIELERGEVKQAIERYREAIRLAPEYATAHNNLAAALRRDGRLSESVTAFKRSQRLAVKQVSAAARASTKATGGPRSLLKSFENPVVRYVALAAIAFVIYRFIRR
jgi:tetratricopeptide (TPR) repeat protein